MPIFEYQCGSCGARFEKILTQAPARHACPTCGAQAQKAVSVTSAHTPGTGSAAPAGRCAPGPVG